MSSIELRGLTKISKRARGLRRPAQESLLLDQISLLIESGSSLAIVGPPGAGKTLLLRILVGLDQATNGDMFLDGSLVNEVTARDRDFAMMFQDFEIYPQRDVYDNMAFSSKLRKGYDGADIAERIRQVADLLGLADQLEAKPAELTESERQRVALGRVLIRDATAYMFDDPFAALEERARSHVRSMTAQWQRALGRTSVFVTNDVSEALSLGDRVAVMHQGYIHQCATPRELYEHPVDMFVASFVGSPPINLIPSRVHGKRLDLPFMSIPLDGDALAAVEESDLVIVGIRPEDCYVASSKEAGTIKGAITFSSKVDEVEWRGSGQFAYLGYEMDEDTELALGEIEEHIEFDLFQAHLVASIGPDSELKAGMTIRLAVDPSRISLFDAVTGANLRPVRT